MFRTGQAQQSIDAAKEALQHNPSLIEVHQWLSDTHRKLGNIQESDSEKMMVEQMLMARPPVTVQSK